MNHDATKLNPPHEPPKPSALASCGGSAQTPQVPEPYMMEAWPWGGFAVYEPRGYDEWLFMFREATPEKCVEKLKAIRPDAFAPNSVLGQPVGKPDDANDLREET